MRCPIGDWLRAGINSGPVCGTNYPKPAVQFKSQQSNPVLPSYPVRSVAAGLLKILSREIGVDCEGRFGPFSGCDDHPLHRSRGVARDVQPGQVG